MSDYKSIVVEHGSPVQIVQNPTRYSLLGRGGNGAVFQLSSNRCVKIYPDQTFARAEREALRIGQASPVFPRLYKSGRKYVVMEYIKGILLEDHLREARVLPKQLTQHILFVLKELKRLGFARRDARLRHLILTDKDNLKVIDHVNSLSKNYKYPKKLLEGLEELGLLSAFLQQVQDIDPELCQKWKSKL